MDPTSRARSALYLGIAGAALYATWSENLAFFALPDNGGIAGFVAGVFANPAAASIGYDLLFLLAAVLVWMFAESRRLGIRFVWIYVVLSFVIAISVTFPLFLVAREWRLAELERRA